MFKLPLALVGIFFIASCASKTLISAGTLSEMAPTGKLRVGIYYGNPVLVQKDITTGSPRGVASDLSLELGRRIGIPVEFIVYDGAAKLATGVKNEEWDIAFLASDPARANEIRFAPPILEIEGVYLVPAGSPVREITDVDRKGVRIAVAAKNIYDVFLSREIRRAQLVRAPTVSAATDMFVAGKLNILAGGRPQLIEAANKIPGARILDGRFMVVHLTAGVPKGRDSAARYLSDFIQEAKASGIVARSLGSSGVGGVSVAPSVLNK